MKSSKFFPQAKLMMECLPVIAKFSDFGLKGGTAINFFVRDMPRLSVDIDLTFLPIQDRESSLKNISDILKKISLSIEKEIKGAKVTESSQKRQRLLSKLFVNRDGVQIKIEPNGVIRGSVLKPITMSVTETVQDLFEMEVDMRVLSFEDLYGGKICAALDRQHPRDLYDVKLLFENEGLTTKVRQTFLAYLLSHDRPINEVIDPNLKNISTIYESEFKGMTSEDVPLGHLVKARDELISAIHKNLTEDEKKFLLSFKNGEPDWKLFPLKIDNLPAVRWKLKNIKSLKEKDSKKHDRLLEELKSKL